MSRTFQVRWSETLFRHPRLRPLDPEIAPGRPQSRNAGRACGRRFVRKLLRLHDLVINYPVGVAGFELATSCSRSKHH